jgi:hypothetical protein
MALFFSNGKLLSCSGMFLASFGNSLCFWLADLLGCICNAVVLACFTFAAVGYWLS